jgi:hypothetical protein
VSWAVATVAILAGCSSGTSLTDATLPPLQTAVDAPSTTPLTPPVEAPSTTPLPGVTTTAVISSTIAVATVITTTAPSVVVWQGWDYYGVPQLGAESVRGTGCGSNGALGEVIPDGIWNVIVGDGTGSSSAWTASRIQLDVRCVYTGASGQQLWNAACAANPESDDCTMASPDWYVVNANSRRRTMPVAPTVQYGVGGLGTSPCAPVTLDRSSPDAPWRFMDSWVVIDHGTVTAVIAACPAG